MYIITLCYSDGKKVDCVADGMSTSIMHPVGAIDVYSGKYPTTKSFEFTLNGGGEYPFKVPHKANSMKILYGDQEEQFECVDIDLAHDETYSFNGKMKLK